MQDTHCARGGFVALIHAQRGREADYTTPVYQLFHDTFAIDLDGDDQLDTDFTSIDGIGQPSPVRWLRNRRLVGRRVPDVRQDGVRRVHATRARKR